MLESQRLEDDTAEQLIDEEEGRQRQRRLVEVQNAVCDYMYLNIGLCCSGIGV